MLQRTRFRDTSIAAAITALSIAGAAQSVFAQETTPPKQPDTTPPPPPAATSDTPKEPEAGVTTESLDGSPKAASAGGAEHKVPDRIGFFKWSPLNLIQEPVDQAEDWMSKNARLDLGVRLAFFFQQASAGPGERTAASQDYRLYGTFHAFNYEEKDKGTAGNIYFRGEYRDKMFTDITPFELAGQIGSLATTTYGQDEHSLALVQLYYEQFLIDGGLRLRVGKLDPDDYFNLGRFADDYRYFDNTIFSAFPASNHPSGGLGFNAQWYITPEWTLTGGMTDVQGKKTHSGFDTIDDGKFFYGLDITYSPTIKGLGKGNYRAGVEYRDAVEDAGRPEDTSFYLNIDQEIAKDIAPFLRYGHGTGNSTGVSDVFSVGIGLDNCLDRPGDACGLGVGFDTPDSSNTSPRSIEYAIEAFYRFQLTRAMQWTVGQQLIIDPINAPGDKLVGVFEMRVVFDF